MSSAIGSRDIRAGGGASVVVRRDHGYSGHRTVVGPVGHHDVCAGVPSVAGSRRSTDISTRPNLTASICSHLSSCGPSSGHWEPRGLALHLVSGTRVGTSIHTVARTLHGSFESGGCGISISGYAVGEPGDGTSFILECPSSRASTVVQVAWDQVEREGQFLSVSFVAPSDLGAIAMTRYDHQPVASSSSGRSSFGSSNRYRPYPPSRRMGQDTPLPGTLLPFLPSPAQFSSQRQHNYFGANLRMARKQARDAKS